MGFGKRGLRVPPWCEIARLMHGLGKMGPEWAPLALTTRCMESKKDLRKIKGMRPVSNLKINENNVKCLKDYVDFIVNTQLSMQSSRTRYCQPWIQHQ